MEITALIPAATVASGWTAWAYQVNKMSGARYILARSSRAVCRPVHTGHRDIENNQVGSEVAGFFESVNSVDSFATNFKARLTLEEMTGRQPY